MANGPYTGGTRTYVVNTAWYVYINGVDSGLLKTGYEFNHALETVPEQFGQDSSPRSDRVSSQVITFSAVLAELTNVNLKHYLAGLAEIDGDDLYYGDHKGEALTTYEVILYPLDADGSPMAGRVITLPKCTIKPNGAWVIDPSADDFQGFPIIITAMKDTSQSAGREFFSITPAVATAPTVSSTSPTDNATGVAIDATITVTFSLAMGIGSITSKTILFTQTGITGTAFDQVITPSTLTLDTTKKILTIGHADLTNNKEYQIIITTGVNAASGVPIAAPYVFTFTTVAA